MQFHVDAWSPGFGASLEAGDRGPADASSAKLETNIELDAPQWRPLDPPAGLAAPTRVLLVDGVRRTDARLWIGIHPGLACSYAAGVVECVPGAAKVISTQIRRTVFTTAPATDVAEHVGLPPAQYKTRPHVGNDEMDLSYAVQRSLVELEVAASSVLRSDDDLLIVDGPLGSRNALPRALGYIKSQQKHYLPENLRSMVSALLPSQRTPVFMIKGKYSSLSWYLRLAGGHGAPWGGIARVECSADLPEHEAIRLADLSAATIPRYASLSFKDHRAPQNLVPIAGLEKVLRQLLGDPKLLHRTLVKAASRD